MLILSRKVEQSILIQGGIAIKVLEVDGDRVKLGITAPAGIRVIRAELLDVVRQENLAAAKPPAAALDTLKRVIGDRAERPSKI